MPLARPWRDGALRIDELNPSGSVRQSWPVTMGQFLDDNEMELSADDRRAIRRLGLGGSMVFGDGKPVVRVTVVTAPRRRR